ncbi:MAG: hypothetical protein WAK16_00755 [Candidatus Cybelea sp.]
MKISSMAKYAVGVTVAAAMLAACSSGGNSSFGPTGVAPAGHHAGLTQLSRIQDKALTQPHFMARPVHTDHGKTWWNIPDRRHRRKEAYLFVGDDSTNDVYVYDFKTGAQVGTLTGFDGPYGQCVDTKNHVYIANFDNGSVQEWAIGGTTPIHTYNSGGEPIGCSVDAGTGNVAVTSFDPGEVIVFPGGATTGQTGYSMTDCEVEWTAGYDNNGNLFGVGEYSSIDVCELAKGATEENLASESGITIDFPGGTQWDGKYIGLGDQEAGGSFESGTWPTTLSGTTLTAAGAETKYSDNCESNYDDTVNATFVDGRKAITNASTTQAKEMVGPNLWCVDAGFGRVDYWAYPAGGTPTGDLASPPADPYGSSVVYGKKGL